MNPTVRDISPTKMEACCVMMRDVSATPKSMAKNFPRFPTNIFRAIVSTYVWYFFCARGETGMAPGGLWRTRPDHAMSEQILYVNQPYGNLSIVDND